MYKYFVVEGLDWVERNRLMPTPIQEIPWFGYRHNTTEREVTPTFRFRWVSQGSYDYRCVLVYEVFGIAGF